MVEERMLHQPERYAKGSYEVVLGRWAMSRTRRSLRHLDTYGEPRQMVAEEHMYHAMRCAGKQSYATKAKAKRAKRSKARRYGKRYSVYRCGYCNQYHLTTHPWRKDWTWR